MAGRHVEVDVRQPADADTVRAVLRAFPADDARQPPGTPDLRCVVEHSAQARKVAPSDQYLQGFEGGVE